MVKQLICIDAGHGGDDPGAVSRGVQEKTITLSIARQIANLLNMTFAFRALLTRDGDASLSLRQRVDIANDANARLFISVHVNSSPLTEPHGVQAYYYRQGQWIADLFLRRLLTVYPYPGSRWNKVEIGDFYVLRHTKMPAILLELGFLSNSMDRSWIAQKENQQQVTNAVLNALLDWNEIRLKQEAARGV